MEHPSNSIIEEREEVMVSPTGDATPTLRTARFLKPSFTGPVSEFPSLPFPSKSTPSDLKKWRSNVCFKCRRNPQKNWKEWVEHLHAMHQSTWRKANIYEAIMSSTYHIKGKCDLVLRVAEKWCSKTNTFIFPWGEATISLEDMMVLGGYSVLGDSVLSPLRSREMVAMKEKMIEAYGQISSSSGQCLLLHSTWMGHFMKSGLELEHEAFLALWLTRYVFPSVSSDFVGKQVFPIAVQLARGTPVALAPALLARIYKDLSLLKEKMVASNTLGAGLSIEDGSTLNLCAPFQLVLLWVWERFPTLRPEPNVMKYGEPRLARWHTLKSIKVENAMLAIDSAAESFQWRPYAAAISNWSFRKFYREREEWYVINSDMDKGLESFARCLRTSELVGLNCIEQYLPHRVAMQFGLDQDIPDCVYRSNSTPEIAWSNYNKPIGDEKLYIPPRLFESDVTARYLKWWKKSFLGWKESVYGESPNSSKSLLQLAMVTAAPVDLAETVGCMTDHFTSGTYSSPLNQNVNILTESSEEDNASDVPPGFLPKKCSLSLTVEEGGKFLAWQDGISSVVRRPRSSFCLPWNSKRNKVAEGLVNKDKLTISELLSSAKKHNNVGNTMVSNANPSLNIQSRISSSWSESSVMVEEKTPMKPKEKIRTSRGLVRGSEEVMADIHENKAKSLVGNTISINEYDGKCSSYETVEVPGAALEARISKLEEAVAFLKAKQRPQVLRKKKNLEGM